MTQAVGIDATKLAALASQLSDMVAAQQEPCITFGELFTIYYEKHAQKRNQAPQNARYFFQRHGKVWESTPVDSITRRAVQQWVDDTGAVRGTYGANRALNVMSAVCNWGIKREYIKCANPCVGVERFREKSRDRFAVPTELRQLVNALQDEPPLWRDFVWLCLFTGARKGNLLAMRWDCIDFDLAHWRIPMTKNGEPLMVALTDPALALLKRRKSESDPANPWVFPGVGKTGHVADAKCMWTRVCQRAGIDDLRIHDLRRSLASYMAAQGSSPYQIGKALGHLDPRSTAVYARLDLTGARGEMAKVHRQWLVNCLPEVPAREVKAIPPPATIPSAGQPAATSTGKRTVAKAAIIKAIQRIGALHRRGATKKEIWRGVALKASELDEILCELETEAVITRCRDNQSVRHWQHWRWELV